MFKNRFTRSVSLQNKWLFVLVVLPLYVYCSSLIGSAIIQFMILELHITMTYTASIAYLNLMVDGALLIIVFLMLKDSMIFQMKEFFSHISDHILDALVLGPALIYGANIVGSLLVLAFGGVSDSENQVLIESILDAYPFIMSFCTVVLAPILEEMIFRGILFTWLYEFNPKIAHIVSACLFGFVHVMSSVLSGNLSEMIQIFPYIFTGLVLSYLYKKHNNICVPIGAHAMNNLISIILNFLY